MSKMSAGLYCKGRFSQDTTIIDRFGSDQEATFPAVAPRSVIGDIFSKELGMDLHRKVFESPDGKSMILFALAGREIVVASLKDDSKY